MPDSRLKRLLPLSLLLLAVFFSFAFDVGALKKAGMKGAKNAAKKAALTEGGATAIGNFCGQIKLSKCGALEKSFRLYRNKKKKKAQAKLRSFLDANTKAQQAQLMSMLQNVANSLGKQGNPIRKFMKFLDSNFGELKTIGAAAAKGAAEEIRKSGLSNDLKKALPKKKPKRIK